ncbi:flippase [Chryseobacterium gambrini]|uniref:Polysaccharide transporter, PST family n=1 Tax=Chryseobacterium gambrini TaxID=373672 RepID=A0A1N7QNJ0_9FLAO|nr:flippase [Chryseobacterium gambrini]SIT24403.1 polysaccharide transporter, PST family [Chryseobacterium gambrini]
MFYRKKIVRNVASLGIIQAVNYIFPLITVPYISRIIGPDGYGIINYITLFVAYFNILIAYGFDMTATRRIVGHLHDKELVSTIFSQVIISRFFLFIISFFILLISSIYLEKIHENFYLSLIIFGSLIGNVLTPQFIYQGFQNLKIISVVSFIKGLLNTILIFILIKKAEDYIYVSVVSTVLSILCSIFLFWFVFKNFNIKLKLQPIKDIFQLIWKEKMIFLSNFVITLYSGTNVIVLGFFASKTEIGYITIAQNFMNLVLMVLTIPIVTSIFPHISDKFSQNKESGILEVRKFFPLIIYITLFASILLFLTSKYLILLMYGSKFIPSIEALRIVSFVPFLMTLTNLMGVQIMVNMRLDNLFFRITAFGAVVGLTINYILSKKYGYIGTAWSFLIIELIITIVMFLLLQLKNIKIIDLKYFSLKGIFSNLKK